MLPVSNFEQILTEEVKYSEGFRTNAIVFLTYSCKLLQVLTQSNPSLTYRGASILPQIYLSSLHNKSTHTDIIISVE